MRQLGPAAILTQRRAGLSGGLVDCTRPPGPSYFHGSSSPTVRALLFIWSRPPGAKPQEHFCWGRSLLLVAAPGRKTARTLLLGPLSIPDICAAARLSRALVSACSGGAAPTPESPHRQRPRQCRPRNGNPPKLLKANSSASPSRPQLRKINQLWRRGKIKIDVNSSSLGQQSRMGLITG